MPRRGTYGRESAGRAPDSAYAQGQGAQVPRAFGYGMGRAAYPQGQPYPDPQAQPVPGAYADARYYAQQPYAPYGVAAYAQMPYAQPAAPQAPAKRRRKGPIVAGIIVAILAIAAAILLAFSMCAKQEQQRRAGIVGQLDGKTEAEIQAELDRVVNEGMFNISIASVIQFADGTAPGDVRIENVPGNPYLMQVAITLDDTGQTVYTTDVIEQNHHIQTDTLDVDLPKGTYNATAIFTALDPDTEEKVGSAAAKVVLEIES